MNKVFERLTLMLLNVKQVKETNFFRKLIDLYNGQISINDNVIVLYELITK